MFRKTFLTPKTRLAARVLILSAATLSVAAGTASAAPKPKDACLNLAGIQKKIPAGYKQSGKRCVKKVAPKVSVPAPAPPDPTHQWAPTVELFYKDTLTGIQTLGSVLGRFGSLQPGELDNAINGLSSCEAVLARDTGATPTTPSAQSAMTQLHTVCALMTKAAGEIRSGISSIDATQITAANTDLQGAVSLLKSVVASLGQST